MFNGETAIQRTTELHFNSECFHQSGRVYSITFYYILKRFISLLICYTCDCVILWRRTMLSKEWMLIKYLSQASVGCICRKWWSNIVYCVFICISFWIIFSLNFIQNIHNSLLREHFNEVYMTSMSMATYFHYFSISLQCIVCHLYTFDILSIRLYGIDTG